MPATASNHLPKSLIMTPQLIRQRISCRVSCKAYALDTLACDRALAHTYTNRHRAGRPAAALLRPATGIPKACHDFTGAWALPADRTLLLLALLSVLCLVCHRDAHDGWRSCMSGSGTLCAGVDTYTRTSMCSVCWMPWAEVAFSGEFRADRAGYESLVEAMQNRTVSPSWRSCGPSETRGAAADKGTPVPKSRGG